MTKKNNYVNGKHKIWAYGSAKYYLHLSTCFWFRLGPVKNFVIKNSLKWVRFIWIYSKIVNMIIWKSVLAPFLVFFLMRWIMLMISNVSTGFWMCRLECRPSNHQIISKWCPKIRNQHELWLVVGQLDPNLLIRDHTRLLNQNITSHLDCWKQKL